MELPTFLIRSSDRNPRACSQCRDSKKKCDKKLPKCARCDRLALDCLYSEPGTYDNQVHAPLEGLRSNDTSLKLDEIIRRLDRLESRDYPQIATPKDSPSAQVPTSQSSAEFSKSNTVPVSASRGENSQAPGSGPLNCQINPSLLRSSYCNLITIMNVVQILHKEGTSARRIAQEYMSTVHTWMPVLPSDFDQKITDFENLDYMPDFAILLLSMYVFVRKKNTATENQVESPVYLLCKHLFSVTHALATVSWDLVHAGILLALFEHMHGIMDRPKMTIGACMTMISLLLERQNTQDTIQVPVKDSTRTWWVIAIVDRYINPFPIGPCGRFLISWGDTTGSSVATEPNDINSHQIGPGIQYSPAQPPWKSLPTDPTLSGEAKAVQLLGEVQQFINEAQFSLDMDCHKFASFHERMSAVLEGLKSIEYCPFQNGCHAGDWTFLSAVLLFYCFCHQKVVSIGIEEILAMTALCFKGAIQVVNERARIFTEAPQNVNLDCHGVSPSMITSLFLGSLGEYLLEEREKFGAEAGYHCKNLLIRLGVDWGLAGNYVARLGMSSLSIYDLLQRD